MDIGSVLAWHATNRSLEDGQAAGLAGLVRLVERGEVVDKDGHRQRNDQQPADRAGSWRRVVSITTSGPLKQTPTESDRSSESVRDCEPRRDREAMVTRLDHCDWYCEAYDSIKDSKEKRHKVDRKQ